MNLWYYLTWGHPVSLLAVLAIGVLLLILALLLLVTPRSAREPVCGDCSGSGKRHVCGMGACVDLDDPCPACRGSGKPANVVP